MDDTVLLRPRAAATLRAICDPWGSLFYSETDDMPQTLVYTRRDADDAEEVLTVVVCPPEYTAAMLAKVATEKRETFAPSRLIVIIRGDGSHAKVPKNAAFEFWTEEELCCNIAKHTLQYSDPHILTAQEEADILGLLSVQRDHLPHLTAKDPYVKFHGIPSDTVIRVQKTRETGVDIKYLFVEK